jgi:hypothetical protein
MIVCVCQIVIGTTTASSNFACCWKLDRCEGLRSKLHSCSKWFKISLRFDTKYVTIGFKTRTDSDDMPQTF